MCTLHIICISGLESGKIFSEHFDFLAPRVPCHAHAYSKTRRGLGPTWPRHGILSLFFGHGHATVHGGCLTPPCAFRSTLIFWPPACLATPLLIAKRDGALAQLGLGMEFYLYSLATATVHGGCLTPPCAFRSTLIFWPPACLATPLFIAKRDGALVQLGLGMEFYRP